MTLPSILLLLQVVLPLSLLLWLNGAPVDSRLGWAVQVVATASASRPCTQASR